MSVQNVDWKQMAIIECPDCDGGRWIEPPAICCHCEGTGKVNDSDFNLGDKVQIPHFEGGLSEICSIVAFRADEVRVENPRVPGWTAWWPLDKCIKCKRL